MGLDLLSRLELAEQNFTRPIPTLNSITSDVFVSRVGQPPEDRPLFIRENKVSTKSGGAAMSNKFCEKKPEASSSDECEIITPKRNNLDECEIITPKPQKNRCKSQKAIKETQQSPEKPGEPVKRGRGRPPGSKNRATLAKEAKAAKQARQADTNDIEEGPDDEELGGPENTSDI